MFSQQGVPHPCLGGTHPLPEGTLCLPARATPQKGPGTSHWCTPQERTWDQSLGYPWERTCDQWKYYGMEMRLNPPPPQVWADKQTETITFPILRMRAVETKVCHAFSSASSETSPPNLTCKSLQCSMVLFALFFCDFSLEVRKRTRVSAIHTNSFTKLLITWPTL